MHFDSVSIPLIKYIKDLIPFPKLSANRHQVLSVWQLGRLLILFSFGATRHLDENSHSVLISIH